MFLSLLATASLVPPVSIPRLTWIPRSDWIDVRRDIQPAAKGDGIADDTAAIQAGLDALSEEPSKKNTLYLPAGTYRITRTLSLHKRDGIALIGCGSATTVSWNGPGGTGDDSRMFWCEGSPRSRFIGIVWDGRNRACTGFDHDSHSLFETEIDHQHEAFVNFTGSGFRVGHDQSKPGSQAAAETTIRNCLFRNCDRGVALLQFNDYDFTLAGCQFEDCGTAVFGRTGCNFYVRECAFRRSRVTDLAIAAEHGCSVRRSTSVGSRMFIDHNCVAPLTVEGCRVDSWTNKDSAVSVGWGPVLVFDTTFTHSPSGEPPIRAAAGQRIIISAVETPGMTGIVQPTGAQVSEIPKSLRGMAGPRIEANRTFLTSAATAPSAIFDARRDFGAKGDGASDDTDAIQRAIDAARNKGHGATAYIPSGVYVVSRTLQVTGRDFRLAGSGWHTRLVWRGPKDGVLVHVADPSGIILDDMEVGGVGEQSNGIDVLQTGVGTARYNRIWVFGMYRKQPGRKGFVARDLGPNAGIIGDHVTGNLRFVNCGRARILFNASYEGVITVEGREPKRDGILGFLTRLGTINVCGVLVRDSQSITMSDYYVEQADRFFEFRGASGDPASRVSISMPKNHCTENPAIAIDNYHGRIAFGPTMPYPGGVKAVQVAAKGANPLALVWLASQAFNVGVDIQVGAAARVCIIGNTGSLNRPDSIPPGGLSDVAAFLDDLARLGRLDLAVNYRESRP